MTNPFRLTESTGWLHVYSLVLAAAAIIFLPSLVCLDRGKTGWLPVFVFNAFVLGCLDGGAYVRFEMAFSITTAVIAAGLVVLACVAWIVALLWAMRLGDGERMAAKS